MRGKNLVKLLKTIELLSQSEGTTIKEMAEILEIEPRSVYRSLEVIESLGFPLYDEKIPLEKEKRWRLEESYLKKLPNINLPEVSFSLPEILSLYLLRSEENLFKETTLDGHLTSAFEKLNLFVSRNVSDKLKGIKALFISASKFTKDYTGKEETIERLMQAMLQRKTCMITYHSFYDDRIKDYAADPLHFFEHDGGLYLFIRVESGHIRTLAVERIRAITATEDSFVYPEDFNPEELLGSAFDIVADDPLNVKIRFSRDQARYVKERKWSKTQQFEDHDDGSVILSMKTSGWRDVKRWVLSYGREATVIEPQELREAVIAELLEAEKNYRP
ncbi:MAG: WYL domain-containing transcriptional regulator [Deltaproteobacteria bacterium]|nr:WYL domain-containing transcriptional regulator [Deltaproteobacteria bacterium]